MTSTSEDTGYPTTDNLKNSTIATSLISTHGLEHMYGRSFLVLIPAIYTAFGLSPIQAGLLDAVRQLSSGITSMSCGFFVDMFQHRRGQALALSLGLIGFGYLLVAISPTYVLILAALVLASAGSALWHPPSLGILSQRFPNKRGFFISLHRSSGNVGDWIGPVIVGALLALLSDNPQAWRWIMAGGTPVMIIAAVLIFIFLRNIGGSRHADINFSEKFKNQFSDMVSSFKGTGMWSIFTVSAVRGMGDRALLWVIPLYLSQELGLGGFWVGVHVALLAVPGIISGPIFGVLSDLTSRKLVITLIMAIAIFLPIAIVLGGATIVMTISIALFGLFLFSVNSLTQAAAIDVAENKGLEATFIGLMWGSNAFFGAISSVAAGALVGVFGWQSAFYFAALLFAIGFISSLMMPSKLIQRTSHKNS
ncbi:MAG: MFS transporter [SAR202 cluster bacterium]|jgi:MFS family permease|nr:MFS transporter [SAR202 cluster bacterium]